jgi:ParB-like chromosome segregation protein Spo0J
MKLIELNPSDLVLSDDLRRSGSARQFEDRLKSSIEQIGLAEPLKVAPLPTGKYLVVDGTMRLRAITALREADPAAFTTIPAYVVDYDRRFELRYQTDIYQDLLPSQLAELVEYLHQTEHVLKTDIARYIGVSPATLRNYTGLWRLLQRRGLFAKVVELMDVGVIPSSNPYAWLRLTEAGLRYVLESDFTDGENAEQWIEQQVLEARRGKTVRFPIKFVEATTDALPAEFYREGEELRTVKRDLGHRRAGSAETPQLRMLQPEMLPEAMQLEPVGPPQVQLGMTRQPNAIRPGRPEPALAEPEPGSEHVTEAICNLSRISRSSPDLVLRTAARSLQVYLR